MLAEYRLALLLAEPISETFSVAKVMLKSRFFIG
jgi:hypothetical protein